MYARLKGGGVDYDIIIPSDYMISKLIKEDMLAELDFNNIPNSKYIDSSLKGNPFDPEDKYSVPYTWGVVGILYNSSVVTDPVTSWDILWDEKYKDQILMFDNSRDAFGLTLTKLGFSQNTTDTNELQQAADELVKQKDVLQAYVMDQIFDKMSSGEAVLAPYYAGDSIIINENNPDVKFAVPDEGTNQFIDSVCIPKTSQNKELAEMYINFLNVPEVALANTEYIGYSTPHVEAYKMLDDEVKQNPIAYPTEKMLSNTETFINLPDETLSFIDDKWLEIKGSSASAAGALIFPVLFFLAIVLVVVLNVKKHKKKKANYYD